MKTRNLLFPILALVATLSLQSCLKDSCERQVTYIQVTPIYKTVDEIHNGTIVNEAARELKNPGKIYFYNNHIFINERGEGVHIIDNTNPESPQNIGFIQIPGNEDISIKNDLLYANSYIDLLTIDIQDFRNATLVERTTNVFPPLWQDIENNIVLVGYDEEEVTEELDCETYGALNKSRGIFWGCANCANFAFEDSFVPSGAVDQNRTTGGGNTGIGGSMARFTIIGDHLYVVDAFNLNVFTLTQPRQPEHVNTIDLGWGIETIFPYQDKLFIGSNSGMFIFDNSNPEEPTLLSEFQHARACDPVFVKDDYAYVTLRDGNTCQGFVNQLDLVDISDLNNPVLEKTYSMSHPHGLSIKGNNLFLCEGNHGLKVFDITNPLTLDQNQLDHEKDITTFDAIALPGQTDVLLVIGADGFYQYRFDDPKNLELISSILVN